MAGLQEELIMPLMKQKLEEYANNDLGYRWCGIRLCNEKTKSKEFEPAVRLFDLASSHYYIFHIDTTKEPESASTTASEKQ